MNLNPAHISGTLLSEPTVRLPLIGPLCSWSWGSRECSHCDQSLGRVDHCGATSSSRQACCKCMKYSVRFVSSPPASVFLCACVWLMLGGSSSDNAESTHPGDWTTKRRSVCTGCWGGVGLCKGELCGWGGVGLCEGEQCVGCWACIHWTKHYVDTMPQNAHCFQKPQWDNL